MAPRKSLLALLAAPLLVIAVPSAAVPGAAAEQLDKAAKALLRSDGLAAEIALKAAQQAGASKPDVAAAMGEAYLDQGKFDKAREWLAPGQFAKGSEGRGWRMLGLLERRQGNLAAAGKAFDRALAFAPKDAELWVEIGRLRYVGGEQLQAIEAADRALGFDGENVRALEFKAQLTMEAGGYPAAIEWFEKALEVKPDDLSVLAGYAAALGEAGRARDMLRVTRKMLTLAPYDARAWFYQAVLAARAGKRDLARSLLGKSGGGLGSMPAADLLFATLELEAGNANVAAQVLGRLVERQSANQRAQLLFARALYESGDYKALFDRFGAMAARSDAPPYLLTIMGRAWEEVGNRGAAAAFLDRAAAVPSAPTMAVFEPGSPGTYAAAWSAHQDDAAAALPYVRSLIGAGDRAGAVRVAERFVQLHPGSGSALGLAGDAQLTVGNPAGALQYYLAASKVRFPDQLLMRIGECSDLLGQSAQMPGLLSQYLDAFPQSRLAARLAASMAAASGDWGAARTILENLRLRGGNRDVRLLADLSLAQLRSGDAKAALTTAERAYALQPGNPVAAQARAMALVEVGGDNGLARQLLEYARMVGGDNALLAATRKKLG